MNEDEFLWDWLKHENNILANRGNFFLIAESALFAIIATKSSKTTLDTQCVLYVTGCPITLFWLLVNIKHIFGTHKLIVNKLEHFKDHPWSRILKERTKWTWSNHTLLGIVLPSLVFLLWLILFVLYLCSFGNVSAQWF